MEVFKQGNDRNSLELQFKDYSVKKNIKLLYMATTEVISSWPEVELKILSNKKMLHKCDFPSFYDISDNMLVSKKIRAIIEEHEVAKKLEFLPAKCEDEIFYFVHIIGEDDCNHNLDEDYRLIFEEEKIKKLLENKQLLFNSKLMNETTGEVFFTEEFVNFIKEKTGVDVPTFLITPDENE